MIKNLPLINFQNKILVAYLCFKSLFKNIVAGKMVEGLSRLGEDVTLWIVTRVHTVLKRMR